MSNRKHAEELCQKVSAVIVNHLAEHDIPLSAVLAKVDIKEPSKSTIEIQFKPGGRNRLLENRYKFPLLSPRVADENQNEMEM